VTVALVDRHSCRACLAEEEPGQSYVRGALLCTLADFPRSKWIASDAPAHAVAHGDERDPVERHLLAGCPGGWYRCAFVSSLDHYRPVHVGDSVLPARLSSADPLVLDALQALDHFGNQLGAAAREAIQL